MEIQEKYIVLDIETYTPSGSPDPEQDILRYVGVLAYNGFKLCLHYPTDKDKIQQCVDRVPYIVNHNLKDYDVPVLERHGISFRSKILIDTYEIVDNRFKQMLYMDLNKGDKSLRRVCEILELPIRKGEFDYSLLAKEVLTGEDYDNMVKYLYTDLEATDNLFKWCYDMFYGFREYMSEYNQTRMSWLTAKSGSTAYKCICNMAGLPEEYDSDEGDDSVDKYEGGFVSQPMYDFVE